MTKFDKIVVGMAERLIVARDCPHMTEYPTSTPCQRCIEREREAHKALIDAVSQEADRRFLLTLRRRGLYPAKKEEAA